MRRVSAIALVLLLAAAFPFISRAQESGYFATPIHDILPEYPPGNVEYDPATGVYSATNELLQYRNATLMANSAKWNPTTGEVIAEGHVRIQENGQMWIGTHIIYNLKTHQMESGGFRTGRPPVYAEGAMVHGNVTNKTYSARYVYMTTDNVSRPDYYLRAKRMRIVPGKYIEAWNAILFVKGIPLLYYPYFRHSLSLHANNLTVMPGDDSLFGPFLYGMYTWNLDDIINGKFHLDYREKRGVGLGPDANLHLGQWGNVRMKYYYLHDLDSEESISSNAFENLPPIPKDRQRFYLDWQATPYTNLNTKALINYQSDQLVLHDFFQGDYGQNPQPNTFVEANKYWNNWSLDAETTPRINSFFDQVERLPDLQLTGYRQQLLNTPLYYESQSSIGYYQRYFAGTDTLFGNTNGTALDYSGSRADTFHQLLLPETFFGWLNFTPRVGGRVTWYGPEHGPGGTNSQATRYVLNTGADVSFKASRLWRDATNSFLEVNGLRHIFQPTLSYVFVPQPNYTPEQLPQFDSVLPNLMILPVEFPDYNDIDSIDSENVLRFGVRNTLQTMRGGQLDNLLDWNLMLDWNLTPNGQVNDIFLQPQQTFDDLYSDLVFKPRSWIALESLLRYDINDNHLNMAFHQVTFSPNDRWSWAIGDWYLHPGFVDAGDDVITSTLFYRLNENWGLRATHYFNAETGKLQEQYYSVYRDIRSWTAALTFRLIDNGGGQPVDYGVAFSISLKADPRYHVGEDSIVPYEMLGQ
jgi:LPS-assembly protein